MTDSSPQTTFDDNVRLGRLAASIAKSSFPRP